MATSKPYEFDYADEYDIECDDEEFDDGLSDDLNTGAVTSRKRKSIGTKRKSARFKASQHEAGVVKVLPCTSKNVARCDVKIAVNLLNKIDRLCEFVHVLMHCILYKINYYNKKTHFDKFLKYNIIVYKCKSEIVCEYITNCVESMRLLLENYYKEESSSPHLFAIGLAVLKSLNESDENVSNLLLKRYTLQIENLKINVDRSECDDVDSQGVNDLDEWNFRESILKCLYARDVKFPSNFKWQIQIRSSIDKLKEMSETEDLFKLFAWRHCDPEEITSISTKVASRNKFSFNRISIRPIKTMNHLSREHKLKVQLYAEEPIQAPVESHLNDSTFLYSSTSSRRKTLKKHRPSFNKTLNSSNSSSGGGGEGDEE